jgi:hypothetical protein
MASGTYTHPTDARKLDALESFTMVTERSQSPDTSDDALSELKDLSGKAGGRREDRTPDLRVANERWERPYLVERARRKRRKAADQG